MPGQSWVDFRCMIKFKLVYGAWSKLCWFTVPVLLFDPSADRGLKKKRLEDRTNPGSNFMLGPLHSRVGGCLIFT